MKFRILVAFLLFATAPAGAEDTVTSEWQVKRDRDGIVVSTRSVAGSKHKEVRAETVMDASLNALVGLVFDLDACNELSKLCRESKLVERISETELIVYSYNDIPWPVADRDAVTRVTWTHDPATGAVRMEARAIAGHVEETKAVRIQQAVTTWEFLPLEEGKVKVVSGAHVDPSGPTPAWLSNLLLVDAPFDTMVSVRDIMASGRYQDSQFDFIQPVPAAAQ